MHANFRVLFMFAWLSPSRRSYRMIMAVRTSACSYEYITAAAFPEALPFLASTRAEYFSCH